MKGKSISYVFPEYKIYSSAIVGGTLFVLLEQHGVNKKIKKVFCFIGDMTSGPGIAHESIKYAINHDLPIKFIIEDNEKSVILDTKKFRFKRYYL